MTPDELLTRTARQLATLADEGWRAAEVTQDLADDERRTMTIELRSPIELWRCGDVLEECGLTCELTRHPLDHPHENRLHGRTLVTWVRWLEPCSAELFTHGSGTVRCTLQRHPGQHDSGKGHRWT